MYIALFLGLLALGGWLIRRGYRARTKFIASIGVALAAGTVIFFGLLSFWGEMLWFEALGYDNRFWTMVAWQMGLAAVGGFFGFAVVELVELPIPKQKRIARRLGQSVGTAAGLVWTVLHWQTVLRFIHRVSTELTDPILQLDTGFYLFTLPFLDFLYGLLLILGVIGGGTAVFSLAVRFSRKEMEFLSLEEWTGEPQELSPLCIAAGLLLLVFAFGLYLDRYHLMYSTLGAVTGPGWTDVHIKLPALLINAMITAMLGIVLFIPALRRKLTAKFSPDNLRAKFRPLAAIAGAAVLAVLVWFVGLRVLPGAVQWLRVEPNEITLEKPYIANNIQFTRHGFNIHSVEEKEFPVENVFDRQTVRENQSTFANIRLWDWRALDAVYKQFQEIRLYYEFMDVDVDRYRFGDAYRQVMVSAREMEQSNLPAQSRTFVNTRFKYTHGYGITMTNVSEFTSEGLPDLLVRDIPPKSRYPELEVNRPEIYYGELTRTHVVVNSREQEFDYPKGDENTYVHYQGKGGVQLSSLWRKFVYGWKFDGTKFLLSGYPSPQSRIMFHRQIRDRVQTLAPFLTFDRDPYVVLSQGRLYWIVDAYTTSRDYPYSEPFRAGQASRIEGPSNLLDLPEMRFSGVNYIRNSVKAVVDAFNGTVDFYVFDEEDPVIRVWQKIFPDLFKSRTDMSAELRRHVRYPLDMLLLQGLVYAKYHMTDPAVFYNQEDLWIRATETYYGEVGPVDPYYIMWEPPGQDSLEYIVMLPFTPKNRQVLIGWIAGMCDGENYGRFLAYNFPKEKRVLGTQQVETKIDQDSFLSGQLSLWDQRGSRVVRGNVLVIPIDKTLLYVEPIYLQAETAAYPELRLVVVMHGDNLSYAETFSKALEGLFTGVPPRQELKGLSGQARTRELAGQAQEAFDAYLNALGNKDFAGASEALARLEQVIEQLAGMDSPADSGSLN